MTFDPNASLDPGQITDRRGMGRAGIPIVGGGLGLIVLLAYTLLGGNPADLAPALDQGGVSGPGSSALAQDCQTGQDANTRDDCRALGFVNSVQAYWDAEFAASGLTYEPVDTVLFSGQTSTGCGVASSSSGPFYCPADQLVYLDLDFFAELRTRFGAQGGPLAQGYVIAHEYGHHVQDLLGALQTAGSAAGSGGASVKIELQADCYAGLWADHAAQTGFLEPPTDAQVADALDAAAAVGDDRIQEATTGQVDPDSWTHGSSEQRQGAFRAGYETGDPSGCGMQEAPL